MTEPEVKTLLTDDGFLNPDMPAQELRLHMSEMTPQEERTARAAIRWANAQISKTTAQKPVILYIEDQPFMRNAFLPIIAKRFPNHEIKVATNYVETSPFVEDPSVVAVIADNVMPRDSPPSKPEQWASTICHNFRYESERTRHMPICVFSSRVSDNDKAELAKMDVQVSEDKGAEELSKLLDFISTKLAATPSHLPADHRPPATRTTDQRARG